MEKKKKRIYEKWWFWLIIIIILIGIIGSDSFQQGFKQGIKDAYYNVTTPTNSNNTDTQLENTSTETEEKTNDDTIYKKDDNIVDSTAVSTNFGENLIKELINLGFNTSEATEIQQIFYKIGVNAISNVQKGAGTGIDNLQSFIAYANNDTKKKFYFTIDSRKLYYAGFLNDTLYDSTKGGFQKNINDVHIPETKVDIGTYSTLQVKAQETIKSYLRYPSSAEFPWINDWIVGRSDDLYKISGKVTAQNGFGVKSDTYFSIWFIKENSDFNVEAIEIDGTRVK